MTNQQKKNKWITVTLDFIVWGLGHYYAGDTVFGITLIAINVIVNTSIAHIWQSTYQLAYMIITIFVCYDGYRKISSYNRGAASPDGNLKSWEYKALFAVGVSLFVPSFLFENVVTAMVLVTLGLMIIIVSYAMTKRSRKIDRACEECPSAQASD